MAWLPFPNGWVIIVLPALTTIYTTIHHTAIIITGISGDFLWLFNPKNSSRNHLQPLYGGFQFMGVPLNHPFLFGIFHEVNHPAMGVPPWLWKPPYSWDLYRQLPSALPTFRVSRPKCRTRFTSGTFATGAVKCKGLFRGDVDTGSSWNGGTPKWMVYKGKSY